MEKNIKEKRKELRLREKHKGKREGCCDKRSEIEEKYKDKALEEEVAPVE